MPYQLKYKDTLYNEEWVREQYLEKGKSTVEVAKEIGCDRTAVNGALKKFGIIARGRISKYELLRDKEWLKKKYVDEKLTLRDIAKLSDSTIGNIKCHLETMGLFIRNSSKARLISDKVVYKEGIMHPSWKGGYQSKDSKTKLIKVNNHPAANKQGYIYWQRWLLEKVNKCFLEDMGCQYRDCDWKIVLEIHHKDGDHLNDQLDNLIILCSNHHKAIERNKLKEDYVDRLTFGSGNTYDNINWEAIYRFDKDDNNEKMVPQKQT